MVGSRSDRYWQDKKSRKIPLDCAAELPAFWDLPACWLSPAQSVCSPCYPIQCSQSLALPRGDSVSYLCNADLLGTLMLVLIP